MAMIRHAVLLLLPALLVACGTTPAPPTTAAPSPAPRARAAAGVPVVVLDPGHNGGNAGAADEIARVVPDGRGGTKPCNTTGTETVTGYAEHAFAFDVARRVARVLTERGVDVRSTRSDDAGVGPCVDRRAATANDARAALTVSIHADSAPAADDRGFHVAVADPALAPSQRGPSLDLARALVAGLEGRGSTPSTYRGEGGLDPRPDLAGLNLARVPAALVECANMRNPGEASVLTDPAGRQRYADGIADGILRTLGR
ncbi:N-acetylmuramoyl-L-alanine amidase [Actinomycetospora chibensis]|uniref:N-acetylmuramoyl-L-alanine amidase n=1 Tax=Actinomycetospora chibensis TaxID=663606 RepID=A0ABV9RKZ7_9PSEU|nr:N-acetylmuramoyl-L-alanine amidase [Actinomycetospora chibensis]MDD7923337.1 N-acetylmuramoyl-L-alanine amidase [Actinomycetospora chibensis]